MIAVSPGMADRPETSARALEYATEALATAISCPRHDPLFRACRYATGASCSCREAAERVIDACQPPTYSGYLYHNPDTGTELSDNHPVESGECPDAENVRPATAEALRHELIEAWEGWHADAQHRAAVEVECARLRQVLRRWQSSGCPDCGGDCASANPPVQACLMQETRDALRSARTTEIVNG